MIYLKNKNEIDSMRLGGKILGDLLDDVILCKIIEGVSTREIDKVVEAHIIKYDAVPILKGYSDGKKVYRYSSCISLNKEIVHAPPNERTLNYGDIITVDVSLKYKDMCVDAARTYIVGNTDEKLKKLISVTQESFFIGLKEFIIGNRLYDVSNAIQNFVELNGFKVIKDFCGHGIGKDLHEDPVVPNFGERGFGPLIQGGLAIALEPMVSEEDEYTSIGPDGWTAYTNSFSAHYENTIIATESGPEILTKRCF